MSKQSPNTRSITCNHCNNVITCDDKHCPSCGMPLSQKKQASPQRRFIVWFIVVVLFSFLMMYALPFFNSTRYMGH